MTTTTASHKPEDLLRQLEAILRGTAQQARLAPVPAAKLTGTIEGVEHLATMLADLQTLVVLEDLTDAGHGMDAARSQWETLEGDRVVTALDDLVATSPTFAALHQAAVTFTSATRFGAQRLRIATTLGSHLATYPRLVGQLAAPKTRPGTARDTSFPVDADAVAPLGRALAALTDAGVITNFHLKGRVLRPDGSPTWRDWRKAQHEGATHWRVWRGTVADGWAEFLNGDWLTAYAYAIAHDQFERAGEPFEIYSKVTYALPADLGGGRSDIDVLVRTADVLLCIECKSGVVLKDFGDGSAAAKTAASAERLDALLATMEVPLTRMYQLLYANCANESPTDVARALSTGRVPVMLATPADVRQMVLRVARGLPVEAPAPSEDAPAAAGVTMTTASGPVPVADHANMGPVVCVPDTPVDQAYTGTELFAIEHGLLRHRWRSGTAWSSWHEMDAPSRELQHVGATQHDMWTDLWVADSTTIWHRWLGPDCGWSEWEVWGAGSGPLTAAASDGHAEVFFYDQDARRRHARLEGTAWSSWDLVA